MAEIEVEITYRLRRTVEPTDYGFDGPDGPSKEPIGVQTDDDGNVLIDAETGRPVPLLPTPRPYSRDALQEQIERDVAKAPHTFVRDAGDPETVRVTVSD